MKRILLLALVMGILLLSACGAPATPSDEASPPPPPAEEPPDYTAWIAWELKNLNQAMIELISDNPNYVIRHAVRVEMPYMVFSPDAEYRTRVGEVPVHIFIIDIGGNYICAFPVEATFLSEAKTHINNAYWLTNKSKLPDEVRARDVSTDEIAKEVSEALALLKLQVSSSYSWQDDQNKWIIESPSPEPFRPPELQPNRERGIQNLTGIYDDYREELSKMISKLELVSSRLPSTTNAGG